MHLFFSRKISELTKTETLSDTESHHCIKSLRHSINDKILISDGNGKVYNAAIKAIKNKQVVYENIGLKTINKKLTKIHIAIAPTKNKMRFEWFLEKATEIGVDIISPIICDNSEKKTINQQRCEKILISAMKQSKSGILPKLTRLESGTNSTGFPSKVG